jgi:hypothetical protein
MNRPDGNGQESIESLKRRVDEWLVDQGLDPLGKATDNRRLSRLGLSVH